MKQSFQKKYNDSINLISHLILTKPTPVIGLLAKHGIVFKGTPDENQIIEEVVELLKSTNSTFEDDLGKLLTIHIQYQGKEMLALEQSNFSSYVDQDQDEDEFWGALAKGAIGIVGGLFKKKGRKRSRGRANSAALLAAQAAARRRATAQAAQAKRDMERQLERIRREAAERRAIEEAQKRREAAERSAREAAARRKQTNTMLMVGGGIALLAIIGIATKSTSPGRRVAYMPTPIPNIQ